LPFCFTAIAVPTWRPFAAARWRLGRLASLRRQQLGHVCQFGFDAGTENHHGRRGRQVAGRQGHDIDRGANPAGRRRRLAELDNLDFSSGWPSSPQSTLDGGDGTDEIRLQSDTGTVSGAVNFEVGTGIGIG